MRLLSFLSAIEKALIAESPDVDGGAWVTSRIVNFHQGLARITLNPRPGNDFPGGSIFLQAFILADGSQCLKAGLSWTGSRAAPVLAVYTTPQINWKLEASRISSTWLEGPPQVSEVSPMEENLQPLAMAMG